jgi:uncharacterized iron-regulated protein
MNLGTVLTRFLLIAGLSGLMGCSSLNAGGGPAKDKPGSEKSTARIFEVSTGQAIGFETLTEKLAAHSIILLGEFHDNAHHHRARARLIEALGQAHKSQEPFQLVVEQLAMGSSVSPNTKVSTETLLAQLKEAGFQDKAWGWPLHEPVFRAAFSQGMAVHGGNLVPGQSMKLFQQGESALPEKLQGLLAKASLPAPNLQALDKALVDGHCGQLPDAMLEPMRLVQRATDLSLLVAATEHKAAIVIAGNGHVRKDFGIPSLLPALKTSPKLVTVGFLESDPSAKAGQSGSTASNGQARHWAVYDYVWLTPPADREDPCKGFQMPKRSPSK